MQYILYIVLPSHFLLAINTKKHEKLSHKNIQTQTTVYHLIITWIAATCTLIGQWVEEGKRAHIIGNCERSHPVCLCSQATQAQSSSAHVGPGQGRLQRCGQGLSGKHVWGRVSRKGVGGRGREGHLTGKCNKGREDSGQPVAAVKSKLFLARSSCWVYSYLNRKEERERRESETRSSIFLNCKVFSKQTSFSPAALGEVARPLTLFRHPYVNPPSSEHTSYSFSFLFTFSLWLCVVVAELVVVIVDE